MASCENFIDEREFKFNMFINFEPVQRSDEGSNMRKFGSCNDSACKRVVNLLEVIYLRLRTTVIQTVTVVMLGVDNRGSYGTSCFRIKSRTDTAEFTDMRTAGRRK